MLSKLKLKYIQSLGQKKFRNEYGVFVAEGPKTVSELLQEVNVEILELFALEDWIGANKQLLHGITVTGVSEKELERISFLSTANQVLAVIRQFEQQESLPSGTDGFILALDTIQDPGNLGTIIRIADWFGVKQVVCNIGSADIYNAKVVQSTMGSIARVAVYYTDLANWLSSQKDSRIYAATLEGQDIGTLKKIRDGILLIGNESRGIDPVLLELANVRITIPRPGKAESLNAAVATGIILSHVL